MAIIEPSRIDIEHPPHIKKYSSRLRFWHWANAIVISGSLLTVLVNSSVLKGWATLTFIEDKLKESGTIITEKQARSIVGGLRDKVWDIHVYFGFCLAALLLFRYVAEYFQLADQKLIRNIKTAYHQYKIDKSVLTARHELVVEILYALFYVVLTVIAITGLCLAFEDDVPLLKSMHFIKEIHGFCMYLVLAFIGVHIIGVFLAERRDSAGIVSDMINGGGKK